VSESGGGDPESKFGETFGFALFRQGSVSFARPRLFVPIGFVILLLFWVVPVKKKKTRATSWFQGKVFFFLKI
jgi:hypothetical protein